MTISLYLFISILLLLFLLVTLVWLYIRRRKQKYTEGNEQHTPYRATPPTFLALQEIVINDASSSEALEQATEDIIKYYGTIETFSDYTVVIHNMCRHRNIKAKTIIQFEKALCEKNPSYVKQITKVFKQALDSRG